MTTSAERIGRGGMFCKDEEEKKMKRHSLNGCKTSKNGGGRIALAVALAGLVCPVLARTVTVASCDRSTGATTLAISAAEAGDGAKALVAAWSPSNIGNAVTNARETVYVGAVAAAETEKSFTIPAEWRGKSGFVRFYLMASVPPYDSRRDYLYAPSDSKAWIDTGFVPTTNSDIRVTLAYCSNKYWIPFGIAGFCYLLPTSLKDSETFFTDFMRGSYLETMPAPNGTRRHEYRLNARGAFIDGACYLRFDPAAVNLSTTYTFPLFGRKNNGSIQSDRMGDGKIFSAQLREGGVLQRDYVPCVKNGEAKMYDRISGTFCTVSHVSGNVPFTAGAEIGPDAQDCGGVESVSSAVAFGPDLTITSYDVRSEEMTVSLGGTHDEGVLYAVADKIDRGSAVSSWSQKLFLGKVAAGTTTMTANVPGTWFTKGYTMRVFWRSAADFPYDREVEWVYSSGNAWVLTGVFPTHATTFSVRGRHKLGIALFGQNDIFHLMSDSEMVNGQHKLAWFYFGQQGAVGVANPVDAFHTYTLGPSAVTVDGVQLAAVSGAHYLTKASTYSTSFFFRRNNVGGVDHNGPSWIAWGKIWEDGQLVCDGVPCVSNGVARIYDRVGRKFLAPAGSGSFTPGETVVNVADAEAVAWSPAVSVGAQAVWDGEGGDESFSTAANWADNTVPDFANGMPIVSFATGGTAAQVAAANTPVSGVQFNSEGNFTLTAAGNASLALGGGGIGIIDRAVPQGSNWRFFDIYTPITLEEDQTWDMSGTSTQRMRLFGNVKGSADRTLTIKGSGCFSIYSTNDFAGTVYLDEGFIPVFSKQRPFGSAAEGGKVVIDQRKSARFELYGAVIDKPLHVVGAGITSGRFRCINYDTGTNVFSAPIIHTGGTLNWRLDDGTVTVLSGGGTFSDRVEFYPDTTSIRTFIIEGVPITNSMAQAGNSEGKKAASEFGFRGKVELHLKNQLNQFHIHLGVVQAGQYSTIHCWTNDTMTYWSDIICGYYGQIDLHGFDQKFGDVSLGGGGKIRSATPATLFSAFDGADVVTWGTSSAVEGAVSLIKSGRTRLQIGGRNTTSGFLRAQNGPVEITSTGVWHGKDVQIGAEESNRHPWLILRHSDCFADPRHTILTMTASTASTFYTDCGSSREPELWLDAGVNAVFKEVIINGRHLAPGTWGGTSSSAQHKDATHFSGSGMITVIGSGAMIIFR